MLMSHIEVIIYILRNKEFFSYAETAGITWGEIWGYSPIFLPNISYL